MHTTRSTHPPGLLPSLLLIVLSLAATPVGAARYHVHTYTEADGLPNQAVFGATQTPDGRLWLATRRGIAVYDGQTWSDRSPGGVMLGRAVRDVQVDGQGRIWVASAMTPASVAWYGDGRWHHLPKVPSESQVWEVAGFALAVGPEGGTWFAMATVDAYLHVWDGRRWSGNLATSATLGQIRAVAPDGDGFILASDRGAWRLAAVPDAEPLPLAGLEGFSCYAVAADGDGGHWFVGETAVVRRDSTGGLRTLSHPGLPPGPHGYGVMAEVSPEGGVYIATPWSVEHVSVTGEVEHYDTDSGLVSVGATDVFTDREGNTWICTMRGVSKIVSRDVRTYDRRHGLVADEVTSILRTGDGRLLMGHEGGLTMLADDVTPVPIEQRENTRCRVMDMIEDADGTIWLAQDRHGLLQVAPDGRQTWVLPPRGPKAAVYALARGERGTLWIGGNDGLGRLVGNRYEKVPLPQQRPRNDPFVRRLVSGRDGGLYVLSGRHGVFHLADGAWRSWTESVEPGGLSTYCGIERPDGGFWVGTASGPARLGAGVIEPVPELAGLLDRPVYAMAVDASGRVWMGTDEGVRIWDGRTLESVRTRDGLAGSEVNRDALWLDGDGSMWVGTDRGATRFASGYLVEHRAEPLIELAGFDLNGEFVAADEPIRRRGPVATLVARFHGLSFIDEKRIRFRTWLEGFEETWQPARELPRGELRYTNLPPGEYRFHVQAVGLHGEASPVAVSAPLRVVPALTRSWWFLPLLALVVVASVGGIVIGWLNRRQAARLEILVAERTARLNDLEKSARSESLRIRTTLQSISDGVLTVDGDGRVLMANPAAETLLGRGGGALAGLPLAELLPQLDDRSVVPGEVVTAEFVAGPGRNVSLEATVAALGSEGAGRVIALRDVTDRRRLAEEIARGQRLESLGALAGGIAHDFNNLLTVILGHASLLESAPGLPDEDRDAVGRIRLSSEKARGLTRQLLTFARGGEPRREPVDLARLVNEAVELMPRADGVTCRCDLPADLWPVLIDADQVGQALGNLLLNAAQAMPEGGIVTVAARNLTEAPDPLTVSRCVELTVEDRGHGLDDGLRERIFEPFVTGKKTGSGLGLAVAYSVAHRHGGLLTAGDAPGGGARFTLVLPAADATTAPDPEETSPARPRAARILVMDDEPGIRRVLVRMLEMLGSEAEAVEDGEAAVAAWRRARTERRPYDLAILDLMIPGGMGGLAALEAIRTDDPGAQALVASGYSNDHVLADPRGHGFAGALNKPFDHVALAEALVAVLGREAPTADV